MGGRQALGVGYLVLKMYPVPPSVLEDLGNYIWMCSQETHSESKGIGLSNPELWRPHYVK